MKELIDNSSGNYFSAPSYLALLDSFEYDKILQVDDDGYQGDSRVLFRDGRKYGWLQFGWGSCSGCDALEGCENIEEVRELQKSLNERIKWFEDLNEAIKFFNSHDWSGDYSWGSEEQKQFIEQAKNVLNNELVRYLAGVN